MPKYYFILFGDIYKYHYVKIVYSFLCWRREINWNIKNLPKNTFNLVEYWNFPPFDFLIRFPYSIPGQPLQDPSDLLQFVRRDQAERKFYCTLCENFSHIVKTHARNHVESKHYPNTFSYSCDQCEDTFTTKTNLNAHRSRKHKQMKTQQYFLA